MLRSRRLCLQILTHHTSYVFIAADLAYKATPQVVYAKVEAFESKSRSHKSFQEPEI